MKKSVEKYTFNFLKHIEKFCNELKLLEHLKTPVIALSGGVDSVALAHVMFRLWKSGATLKPRFIHIDHGTRAEIKVEATSLSRWAKLLDIDFVSVKIDLDLSNGNFESTARDHRYNIFKEYLNENEQLLTAHHLDDSFEWTLMQNLKTTSVRGGLGIPVKTDRAIRPFMCVTKTHIIKYAKENQLSWFEDKSNTNLNFERNYVRKFIKESIANKYPKYLKQYASRQNELAELLNLSACKSSYTFKRHLRSWGELVHIDGKLNSNNKDLLNIILSYSKINRGSTSLQYEKLCKCFNNFKKGPVSFSGGIMVFLERNYLLIVKQGQKVRFYDKGTQIPGLVPYIKKSNKKNSIKKTPDYFSSELKNEIEKGLMIDYAWRNKSREIFYWI